MVKGLSLQKF